MTFDEWWSTGGCIYDGECKEMGLKAWQASRLHLSNELTLAQATAHDALVLIDSWIQRGNLSGNGTDKNAQRNGMVLAYNLVYALSHGQEVEFGPHRDEHSPPAVATSSTSQA